jgi:hypothetical protein
MQKDLLNSKLKSTGNAYLFFLLFGAHYLYLGQVGKQILFWCTGGGFLIWAFIDLFTMGSKVDSHNLPILSQIRDIDREEKDDKFKKDLMMMQAASK